MNTNDLNPLESRMRSWTPCRPSPAVEQRLFGVSPGSARARVRDGRRRHLPGWGWLVPVACCLVLALALQLVVSNSDQASVRGERPAASFNLAGLGNRTLTAFAPAWANSAMNNVNGETFESTNWTTGPSPMRALPVSVFLTLTNGLIQ